MFSLPGNPLVANVARVYNEMHATFPLSGGHSGGRFLRRDSRDESQCLSCTGVTRGVTPAKEI